MIDGSDEPGAPGKPPLESALRQDVPIDFIFITGTRSSATGNRTLSFSDLPAAVSGPSGGAGSFTWLSTFKELSTNTAGRIVFTDPLNKLESETVRLAEEIKNQYVIGYIPATVAEGGKWQSLRVRVSSPFGRQSKLHVRSTLRHFVPKAAATGTGK